MLVLTQTGPPRATPRPIRPLELRQYRYFVVLAEELHFARAAERIGIGQSNLSREVKALEQQLGLRLFYRTSRRTELTAVGSGLSRPPGECSRPRSTHALRAGNSGGARRSSYASESASALPARGSLQCLPRGSAPTRRSSCGSSAALGVR